MILTGSAMAVMNELMGAGGTLRGRPALLPPLAPEDRPRFCHIADQVGQRIDYALDVLLRTAFVSKVLPVGAPRGARATYEIPDPYLRFWFQVLYTEAALIAGGQGDAVLERVLPRWQTHLGFVFEEQARAPLGRRVQWAVRAGCSRRW